MRVLLAILVLLALPGCRGGGTSAGGAVSPHELVAADTARDRAGMAVVKLGEIAPSGLATPLLLGPSQLDLATDDRRREDAVAVQDAAGRPCWLYSTSRAVAIEVAGEAAPPPTVARGRRDLQTGEGGTARTFTFDRPSEELVVSTARDRKERGGTGSWNGQAEAVFTLPAGETRLTLRAPVTPDEAPPLEIELWVDGELLAEEFLSLGVMVDTMVTVEGGEHRFELRCPRLQRVEWAHLVSPIELILQVEASHGRVLVYGWEGRPPRTLSITYPVLPEGSDVLQDWADALAQASTEPLHRRLERGCCAHDVVLAPVPTDITYSLDVPENARLRLDLGVDETARSPDAVHGEVHVDVGGVSSLLWSGPASDGDACDRGGVTVSLAEYAGSRVEITLATRGDTDGGRAYWIEPTLLADAPADVASGPSVILVSLDTLRADHLGCYGYHRPTSPTLDKLASRATLYQRAYSTYPTTMLSHMAMLRGTHPDGLSRSLALEAGTAAADHPEDASAMVQQRLQAEGWATAAFTGGGSVDKHWGFEEGFDAYCDCRTGDDAEALAARADRWLEAHAGVPFFLFLHTYEVHGPYDPPPGYSAAAGGKPDLAGIDPYAVLGRPPDSCAALDDGMRLDMIDLYDGEIRYTDEALVAPLLATLDRLGIAEDTLLVITSDHGEEFGEHGCWLHGEHLYDETVHVPLIIRYPGGAHRGEVVDGPVSLVDVAPTILAALGLDHGDMEGEPLPRSAADARDANAVARGVRFDKVGHESRSLVTSRTFVAGAQYKLILSDDTKAGDRAELYDLASDPWERLDRLDGAPLPPGDPAASEFDRLRAISDPHIGRTLLEFDSPPASALPPDLEEQLRALGYTR